MTSLRFFSDIRTLSCAEVFLLGQAMAARSTGSAEPEDGAARINAVESVGFNSAAPTTHHKEE
jgi:hypothetical protein